MIGTASFGRDLAYFRQSKYMFTWYPVSSVKNIMVGSIVLRQLINVSLRLMFSAVYRSMGIFTIFLEVKFSLWIHKQMADNDGTHGAEAVDHPRLFHGFPINTALDYKGEGPRCKLQSSHS